MLPAIRLTAVLAFAATAAAYEVGGPVNDLRLHGGVQMAPRVKEETSSYQHTITTASGSQFSVLGPQTGSLTYDWANTRQTNFTLGVDYVRGWNNGRRGAAGFFWGAGLHFSDMNLAPDGYAIHGYTINTVRQDVGLSFKEFGPSVMAGYATRPRETGFGEFHLEFGGFLRGGPMRGQTESQIWHSGPAGSYPESIRVDGWGWWYATGPQAGIYVVDKAWLVGLVAEWAIGQGVVNFESMPNGDTSVVTLFRNGLGASLQLGGRF